MTQGQTSPGAEGGDDATVYIARDGTEIGECRRGDLEQLIREGELLPTDHYWHEGMDEWRALETFAPREKVPAASAALPIEATQRIDTSEPIEATQRIETVQDDVPAPEPPPADAEGAAWNWKTLKVPADARKHLLLAAIIVGGFLIAILIAIVVIRLSHDPTPVRPAAVAAPTPIVDREQDRQLRDKAAAELRAKLEALPSRAEPPLYTFYYDVAVDMRRSGSPRTPWEAIVRWSEIIVDPQSEQTTKRTEFMLRTEYRDGQWTFKHYKASTRDLVNPAETQDEQDEATRTPPPLVTMLGLRIQPPDTARR